MIRIIPLTLMLPAALALPVFAQEQPPQAEAPSALAERAVPDLLRDLGAASFLERQAAQRELTRRGDAVREALQEASEEHEDAEVRWRAGRLLRQLDAPEGGQLTPSDRDARGAPELQRRADRLDDVFDSLFERLERDFQIDVPRRGFFQDDFFNDLRRQMDQLQQGQGLGFQGQAQGSQIRIGPDGVRIDVQETDENGEQDTKTYEAPDLDSFREQYPEIAERYLGDGNGIRLWTESGGGPFQRLFGGPQRDLRGWLENAPGPMAPAPAPRGPVLGVVVEPVGDQLRGFLGLDEGHGLAVREVVEGSLAARLGVAVGDVVLDVDGAAIGSAEDVGRALRAAKDRVVVRVNRAGSEKLFEADYDPPAAEDEEAAEPARELKPTKRGG